MRNANAAAVGLGGGGGSNGRLPMEKREEELRRLGGGVGAEEAREERRVHVSLNMRRKFFHALAVVMFVPGVAVDVSSVHFSCLSLEAILTLICSPAGVHLPRLLSCLRPVHLLRVRTLLRPLPRRRPPPYLLLRVYRLQG